MPRDVAFGITGLQRENEGPPAEVDFMPLTRRHNRPMVP